MPPEEPGLSPAPEIIEQTPEPAPRPERDPFWTYSDLALVLGLSVASVVIIVVAVGIAAIFFQSVRTDPTPLILPTQFALYGFIYVVFWIVFRTRYDRPVLPSLGWKPSSFNLPLTGLAGVALAFAVSGIASLLHTPKVESPIDKLTHSPVSFAIFAVMAVTIAPLFEEMFFRGFIQPLLSRTFGVIAGILITAALFGSLHAPEYDGKWQYAFAVSLVGVVLGWVRARAKSIVPSTVMHGCYNAAFVVALAVTKQS